MNIYDPRDMAKYDVDVVLCRYEEELADKHHSGLIFSGARIPNENNRFIVREDDDLFVRELFAPCRDRCKDCKELEVSGMTFWIGGPWFREPMTLEKPAVT